MNDSSANKFAALVASVLGYNEIDEVEQDNLLLLLLLGGGVVPSPLSGPKKILLVL